MRIERSKNHVPHNKDGIKAIRDDVSERLRVGSPSISRRWSLRGPDEFTINTVINHRWIVIPTEMDMEIIMDILTSKLIHLDDQLELVTMAWENYGQYGEGMVEYLEYDIYDLIGPTIEAVYADSGEYDREMSQAEANRVITGMANQMYKAVMVIQDKLNTHVLPALSQMGDDTHIGAVRLAGGDMAIRLDNVQYTKTNNDVDGTADQ